LQPLAYEPKANISLEFSILLKLTETNKAKFISSGYLGSLWKARGTLKENITTFLWEEIMEN
jgi:hypothetical protein